MLDIVKLSAATGKPVRFRADPNRVKFVLTGSVMARYCKIQVIGLVR